jgi:hypothetical protein
MGINATAACTSWTPAVEAFLHRCIASNAAHLANLFVEHAKPLFMLCAHMLG